MVAVKRIRVGLFATAILYVYTAYGHLFENITTGKFLEGEAYVVLFGERATNNIYRCIKFCQRDFECKSINYNEKEKICSLSRYTSATANVTVRLEWSFADDVGNDQSNQMGCPNLRIPTAKTDKCILPNSCNVSNGFVYLKKNKVEMCVKINMSSVNMTEATETCLSQGGSLLDLATPERKDLFMVNYDKIAPLDVDAGSTSSVAIFSVSFRGTSPTVNFPNDVTVKFDNIITDIGNVYNIHSGIFHAPVAGYYMLTFNVYSATHREGCLFVEGRTTVCVATNNSEGSNTAFVYMDAQHEAWVTMTTGIKSDVFGTHYSTFSGFLVRPGSKLS